MVVRAVKSATGTVYSGRSTRRHEFASGTEHARRYKLGLLLGFTLFVAGVSAAYFAPADGYEVSIYWSTPPAYWIGVGGALLIAATALLYGYDTHFAPIAALLGGFSVASFLALPIIRDYHFFGYGDPLTHLGNIRGLWGGWSTFFDPIYPGSYVFTIFVGQFAGLPVNRAMTYVLFAMALVFVIFIPLTVYTIVPDRRALFIGLFSGFLLLPINNVSTSYLFHPYTMNALYSALVIYLLVGHITRTFEDGSLPSFLSASALVLPIATASLLFFHPQTTSDVIVIFGVIAVTQLFFRRFRSDHPLAGYRAIYGQFAFLLALFVIWANTHEGASQTLDLLITGVLDWITGSAETAQIAQQRGRSLESIGVTVYELFVKLFLVSAIYCVLAAGVAIAQYFGWLDEERTEGAVAKLGSIKYFLLAGIGLLPYVVVHTVGRADAYLFRHIGFGMVIVTILGAVGLYFAVTRFSRSVGSTVRGVFRPTFGAIAAAVIVLSLLSVYASPFIYLPGQHVSEYQMEGYQTAFEMQPDDRSIWFGGVRQSSNRYEEAMYAAPDSPWGGSPDAVSSGAVSDENVTRLGDHYRTHPEPVTRRDHYFALSKKDFQTETVAYQSLRYTRANLSTVPEQEGVYNVYSNGEYRLFYVDTPGTPIMDESAEASAGGAEPAADDDAGGAEAIGASDSETATSGPESAGSTTDEGERATDGEAETSADGEQTTEGADGAADDEAETPDEGESTPAEDEQESDADERDPAESADGGADSSSGTGAGTDSTPGETATAESTATAATETAAASPSTRTSPTETPPTGTSTASPTPGSDETETNSSGGVFNGVLSAISSLRLAF